MASKDKPNWFVRHKVITLIIVLFVVITIAGALGGSSDNNSNKSSSKPKYSASLQPGDTSMLVVNPADLRVYGEVKNTGSGSGKPSCTLQAHDDSYTYTGTDVVERTSDLQPGGVWDFSDDLTVTHQGAQYVTKVDISCK